MGIIPYFFSNSIPWTCIYVMGVINSSVIKYIVNLCLGAGLGLMLLNLVNYCCNITHVQLLGDIVIHQTT